MNRYQTGHHATIDGAVRMCELPDGTLRYYRESAAGLSVDGRRLWAYCDYRPTLIDGDGRPVSYRANLVWTLCPEPNGATVPNGNGNGHGDREPTRSRRRRE